MNQTHWIPDWRACATVIAGCVPLMLAPAGRALAAAPFGLYLGGAIGRSEVEASSGAVFGPSLGNFKGSPTGYKVMVGVRPITMFGAELEYVDLGRPRIAGLPTAGFDAANVSTTKGFAAFGMLYLPVPVVDVFVKAGFSRLDYHAYASYCAIDVCQIRNTDQTDTKFAAGAGVQFKFGSWTVRGEYERFNLANNYPSLLAAGLTWSFP